MRPSVRRYATILLVAGLSLLTSAFWADCILGPYTPLAAGFQAQMEPWAGEAHLPGTDRQWSPLLWDGVAQFYPWRLHLGRSMRSGEIALWNPHQMCGYPFVGNGQSALFYPPNWLLALVDVKWGMGLLAALHYALAAILTALLARTLGLGHLPAAFAGIAFAFGGFIVTWTELPTLMNAAAWLPGALLGVALIFRTHRWGVPVLGVSLSMTLLAGHFQIAAYVWSVAAVYALARMGWAAFRRRPARALPLAAGVGLALLLSAPQVLPSLELIANSPRGHGLPSEAGWRFHQGMALRSSEWITFLDPDAFGNPAHGDHQLTPYGIPYSEHCGFVGIVTLLLAVLGAYFSRTKHYAFFAVLAAVSVHIAMAGPLASYIYLYVPKLGQAGSFARFLSVFTFAAAMTGAFGLQGICTYLQSRSREEDDEGRCPWNLSPATGLCAVAILILCWELLPWAHEFLPRTRREHVYPVTPAIEALQAGEGRVLTVTPRDEWSMARTPRAVLPPNAATVFGYDSISGYDSLMLSSYRAYLVRAEGVPVAPAANGNMLLPMEAVGPRQALMGLGTVVARRRPGKSVLQSVDTVAGHGGVGRFSVEPVAPRAFTLPTLEWTSMFLGDSAEMPLDALRPCAWQRPGNGRIRISLPSDDSNRSLVVTETFYPGWSAYANGESRAVDAVAEHTFCGVRTQPDDRQVDLVFEPAAVRVGCFLCLLGLAALAAGPRLTGRDD